MLLVERHEWEAAPAKDGLIAFELPARRIILTHTEDQIEGCTTRVGDEDCRLISQLKLLSPQPECIERVKSVQALHSDLKDIPYNFLVGDDGYVYEGRGFEFQGEITKTSSASNFDDIGLFVAFIGTFADVEPTELQKSSLNDFLESSVRRDMIDENFIVLSQDQLTLSATPAQGLLEVTKSWNGFHSRKQTNYR